MMEVLLQNHIHKKIIIIKRREREREHAELQFRVWRPLLQEISKLLKMTAMGVKCITQFVASTIAAIFTPKQHLETQA